MVKKKTGSNFESTGELALPLNSLESVSGAPVHEEPSRGAWDNKVQYMFMVISYAVGLGNVWRFPYLCQRHGGGAFLIPYLIMLFLEGMPLLYLELAIGQKMQRGSMGVWNTIHPYLGGIGAASAAVSLLLVIYYNAIITWCFFYLFNSFQSQLPWKKCPTTVINNVTLDVPECSKSGATSYYWYREALDISSGIDETAGINWKILLCFLFAWLVVYLCVCKGIKSSGKVVYFTATFPYVVLTIFLIRGLTLKGSLSGIEYMFTPKVERLKDPMVWLDAAAQIFYSFGLAFGGLIAFASYNPQNNNCQRDTIVVGMCNWCTAIYGCLVIFSILGYKATIMFEICLEKNMNFISHAYPNLNVSLFDMKTFDGTAANLQSLNISSLTALNSTSLKICDLQEDLDKAAEGTGLAFIIFTQAIVEFGASAPFWSIIFFLMLLALGLGTEFATIEGVATSLRDITPFPWMKKKWALSGVLCLISMVVGLLFTFRSGSYWVGLFDFFSGTFGLMIVALLEIVAVAFKYGVNRFCDDIEGMIGFRPNIYWRLMWKVMSPFLITTLLVATLITKFIKPVMYRAYDKEEAELFDASYPWFANVAAVILVLIPIIWLPGVAVFRKIGVVHYEPESFSMEGIISSRTAFISNSDVSTSKKHTSAKASYIGTSTKGENCV